jgi:hypothetical protein
MKVLNPNVSTTYLNMWLIMLKAGLASDRVLVNLQLSIKELRQSTGKGTTSYCTELKQHNVDKTHIEELVKMYIVVIKETDCLL